MYINISLACMDIYRMHLWLLCRPEEGVTCHRTEVIEDCEPSSGCCELDLGPLQPWLVWLALFRLLGWYFRGIFYVTAQSGPRRTALHWHAVAGLCNTLFILICRILHFSTLGRNCVLKGVFWYAHTSSTWGNLCNPWPHISTPFPVTFPITPRSDSSTNNLAYSDQKFVS